MIWLLACSTPRWSDDAALAPTLQRLDADGSGRVEVAELVVVAPGTNLALLDTSGDGVLSPAELAAWMDQTDPLSFDHQPGRPAVSRERAAAGEQTAPEVRMLFDLFLFLTEALQAADPALPRPGEHRLRQAAQTASLSSPESQAVLTALRQGYTEAGLTFPPGLEPR